MLGKSSPFPVILSAPSGAGKTTLRKELLKKPGNMSYSVSVTTRKPREGETGEDYKFISVDTFREWIAQDRFCGND